MDPPVPLNSLNLVADELVGFVVVTPDITLVPLNLPVPLNPPVARLVGFVVVITTGELSGITLLVAAELMGFVTPGITVETTPLVAELMGFVVVINPGITVETTPLVANNVRFIILNL